MNIDIHSHVIPEEVIKYVLNNEKLFKVSIVERNNKKYFYHSDGITYPKLPLFFDIDSVIANMHDNNIDMKLIAIAPPFTFYNIHNGKIKDLAKIINDSIIRICKLYPSYFRGVAHLPLQNAEQSLTELKRIINEPHLVAVQLGASLYSFALDVNKLLPIFEILDSKKIPIIIHPFRPISITAAMDNYYLSNILGNPIDTTIAACNLIYSGIFDKFKNLRIVLVHGGGFLPYQIGRLDRGFKIRQECKENIKDEPRSYLKHFYYDCIIFDKDSLIFLLNSKGKERVMLGTDFPFDMCLENPVAFINDLCISKTDKEKVLGINALKMFNIKKGGEK